MRPPTIGPRRGDRFVLADKLALDVLRQARVTAYQETETESQPTI